ncbi:MAG: response regulator [Candidatus Kerfeldbacteria bacterium]|jgi:DNA-binding response OmpR family regulator
MDNKEKKILIIEDDKSLSKAISDKLKRESFEVFTAFDGQEGLEVAFEKKPDLILLDLIMPVMDGIATLKKLRKDLWGSKVPVVILTNLSTGEEVSQAMSQGVYDYLVKTDWELNDIIKVINNKLNK